MVFAQQWVFGIQSFKLKERTEAALSPIPGHVSRIRSTRARRRRYLCRHLLPERLELGAVRVLVGVDEVLVGDLHGAAVHPLLLQVFADWRMRHTDITASPRLKHLIRFPTLQPFAPGLNANACVYSTSLLGMYVKNQQETFKHTTAVTYSGNAKAASQ